MRHPCAPQTGPRSFGACRATTLSHRPPFQPHRSALRGQGVGRCGFYFLMRGREAGTARRRLQVTLLLRQGTHLPRESVSLPVGCGDFRGPSGLAAGHSQKSRCLSLGASHRVTHRLLASPVPGSKAASRCPRPRTSWAWVPSGAPELGCSRAIHRTLKGLRRVSGAVWLCLEAPASGHSHLPKAPPPSHSTLGVRVQARSVGHRHATYSKHTLHSLARKRSEPGKGDRSHKAGEPRGVALSGRGAWGSGMSKCLVLDAGCVCVHFAKSHPPEPS